MLLKFAIQDFIEDRKFRNLREETLEGYLKTLDQFHEYCVGRDVVRTEDITPNYVLILVFLGTGSRVGEVINMKWEDIDWKNSQVLAKGKQRFPRPIPHRRQAPQRTIRILHLC